MRTAQIDKTGWSQVDAAVTKEIKEILSLPERASNHYLQADRSAGGCGVPSAAADCDFYLVDTAFKLLTSRDEHVQLAALGQLTRTFKARMKRSPTDGDLASYLSGCMEGDYATSTTSQCNLKCVDAGMSTIKLRAKLIALPGNKSRGPSSTVHTYPSHLEECKKV
ncbi:retrovirus-related Pol polyprotein from type-1 retrotransposable element R2 [Trichonephila clavipes]|nr:retrovirus-related Pol polyprotein from type-1 retrotransposable element R2 [Trichonephila clavipes]